MDESLWADLKESNLEILREAVKDFIDIEKPRVKEVLAEVAKDAAKQAWLLVNGNDAERAQAPGNLRSLKAQVIIAAADAEIVASKELRSAFIKIVESLGLFLLKHAPVLVAAV